MQLTRHARVQKAARLAATVGSAGLVASTALLAEARAQAVPKASYVTAGSFQLPAKGRPGAPDDPAGIALAPDRSVHITDADGLVFVFDSTGVYRRSYGEAELDRAAALAIGGRGESFVLDRDRNQVLVFGPGGQFLRAISAKGSRAGQLSDPIDLDLGPAGHLYVLDRGRRGIQIFSWDGTFVRDVAFGETIEDPASLAVGRDGRIYVADERTANQVYAFPPFIEIPWVGATPRGIAGRLTLRGAQFGEPLATAVNELGSVVVLDARVGRLFRTNGSSQTHPGPNDLLYGGMGTGRGSFREPVAIAFAGPEQLLILDRRLRKVERIRLTTEEGLDRRPVLNFPIRVTRVPRGLAAPLLDIATGPDGSPRLLLQLEDRTATLMGAREELYETVYSDSVSVLLPDPSVIQRQFTQDIREIATGQLLDSVAVILDPGRDRFSLFDLASGRLIGSFGDNYRDNRRLDDPLGLVVLPDGRIVIADTGNDQVKIFSADLASLVASYPFADPAGVVADPQGRIFVWNEDGSMVGQLIAAEGRFEPLNPTLLPGPVTAITFDQAGNLFALDRNTQRITIVEAGLNRVLTQLGSEGGFDRPVRLVVDRQGNIYVPDAGAKRTWVYRWDVEFPPIAGFQLDYTEGAAVLSWEPGPSGFIRGYEIQGAAQPDGPYQVLARAERSPHRVEATDLPATPPRYIRVAPVFITGVRGRATDPLPLSYFASLQAFRRENYNVAMEEAGKALRLIEEGVLSASPEVQSELAYTGFAAAYQLGEYRTALDWAQQAARMPLPREQLIQLLFQLAEVYLRLGHPQQASQQILTLVGQGPRKEYYENPDVIDQSFRIYRGVRDAGEWAEAMEFLRLYHQSIPSAAGGVQAQYRDSLTVFSTRWKLAEGFQHWQRGNFGEVVSFFENVLTQGGLSEEQEVVSRQLLAAAYYAYGRRGEAEDTFRTIYSLRPGFDLNQEIPRLRQLYGLTIYNPETRRFFGSTRPGS